MLLWGPYKMRPDEKVTLQNGFGAIQNAGTGVDGKMFVPRQRCEKRTCGEEVIRETTDIIMDYKKRRLFRAQKDSSSLFL